MTAAWRVVRGFGLSVIRRCGQCPQGKLQDGGSIKTVEEKATVEIAPGGSGGGRAAIVAAIINLAHNLDLRVIAEGVETGEQLAYLREKGCDEIQGYFSRPCEAGEFAALLRNGHKLL